MDRILRLQALPSLKYSPSSSHGGDEEVNLSCSAYKFCSEKFRALQALGEHQNPHKNEKEVQSLVRKTGEAHLGVRHDQRFKTLAIRHAPNQVLHEDGITRLTLGPSKKSEVPSATLPPSCMNKPDGVNFHILSDKRPSPTDIPSKAASSSAPRRVRKRFIPKFNMAAAAEFVHILRGQREGRPKDALSDGNPQGDDSSKGPEIEELDLSLKLRI